MVSENDFMEAPEDEEEREDDGICWNVYFKRIRVALGIEAKDVVAVFEFAPGPLITANIVHKWGLGSHQLKYRPMTLLDFDRFTQGLPSYVARKSLTEARAEEERRAAEELSARRKASAQKRKETLAAKKALSITSEARQAWVRSLEAAEEMEEAEKIANEEMAATEE